MVARARAPRRPTARRRTLLLPVRRSRTQAEKPPPRSARVLPIPRHDPFLRCWIRTLLLEQTSPETVSMARGLTILTVGFRLASQPRCLAAARSGVAMAPNSSTGSRHAAAAAIRIAVEFTPSGSAKTAPSLTGGAAVHFPARVAVSPPADSNGYRSR